MLPVENPASAPHKPTGRPLFWTPRRLAKFGKALVAYLRANPDALSIEAFAHQYKPPFALSEVLRYLHQPDYALFAKNYALAREIVRDRLIAGAMIRDQPCGKDGLNYQFRLDPNLVHFILMRDDALHAQTAEEAKHTHEGRTLDEIVVAVEKEIAEEERQKVEEKNRQSSTHRDEITSL